MFLIFQDFMKSVGALSATVFVFVTLRSVYLLWRRRSDIDHAQNFSNLFIALCAHSLRSLIFDGWVLALLALCYQHRLSTQELTSLSDLLPCLLLVDFAYYVKHRCEHRMNVLWAAHSVHHSSSDFNLTTTGRTPWLRWLYDGLFFAPPVLLGYHPLAVWLSFQWVLFYQIWIHTQHIGSLGLLDRLINTPANHRVHHGSQELYQDTNFGGILMLWDHLFGTYQKEVGPARFGLTPPLLSANPFVIQVRAPLLLLKTLKTATSWRERWGYLFFRPGWKTPSAGK